MITDSKKLSILIAWAATYHAARAKIFNKSHIDFNACVAQ
jgi:hypothetical protein